MEQYLSEVGTPIFTLWMLPPAKKNGVSKPLRTVKPIIKWAFKVRPQLPAASSISVAAIPTFTQSMRGAVNNFGCSITKDRGDQLARGARWQGLFRYLGHGFVPGTRCENRRASLHRRFQALANVFLASDYRQHDLPRFAPRAPARYRSVDAEDRVVVRDRSLEKERSRFHGQQGRAKLCRRVCGLFLRRDRHRCSKNVFSRCDSLFAGRFGGYDSFRLD